MIEKKNSFSIQERLPDVTESTIVRGIKKFAFQVEDINATAAKLKAENVKFVLDIMEDLEYFDGPVKSFIVEDHDGNWLQFFEREQRE